MQKRVHKNMHIRINIRKHAYVQAYMRPKMEKHPPYIYKHAHTCMCKFTHISRRPQNDHIRLRVPVCTCKRKHASANNMHVCTCKRQLKEPEGTCKKEAYNSNENVQTGECTLARAKNSVPVRMCKNTVHTEHKSNEFKSCLHSQQAKRNWPAWEGREKKSIWNPSSNPLITIKVLKPRRLKQEGVLRSAGIESAPHRTMLWCDRGWSRRETRGSVVDWTVPPWGRRVKGPASSIVYRHDRLIRCAQSRLPTQKM